MMTRFVTLAGIALVLSACGAAPMHAPAPRSAGAIDALKSENVYFSKDIRYVCEQMIKRQTPAKANKTNVARMGTALYHVQTLAKAQKRKDALAIAEKALERYHALSQAVTGNLTSKAAEEMKAVLMTAFEDVLATLPASEQPAK